jgi:hypothetical protein
MFFITFLRPEEEHTPTATMKGAPGAHAPNRHVLYGLSPSSKPEKNPDTFCRLPHLKK